MLGCVANLLYSKYLEAGKGETCPRPKVIMNEDILTTQPKKLRAIFEKFGTVGIDASLFISRAGEKKNSRQLIPVFKNFNEDKNHIFIFPEGKMSAFDKLDLKKRFQSGIGNVIRIAAKSKERVKVIPLGFAYNTKHKKDFLGSIHFGEPVYFKKDGNNILVSSGNVTRKDALPGYSNFFSNANTQNPTRTIEDVGYKVLTHEGKPVEGKEQKSYIAGVLVENLRICRQKALDSLPKESLGENVTMV